MNTTIRNTILMPLMVFLLFWNGGLLLGYGSASSKSRSSCGDG